jgi:hypothetical protein
MDTLVITITVETSMDPSQLLEIIQEQADNLVDEIETYGEEAEVAIDEIEVAYK